MEDTVTPFCSPLRRGPDAATIAPVGASTGAVYGPSRRFVPKHTLGFALPTLAWPLVRTVSGRSNPETALPNML